MRRDTDSGSPRGGFPPTRRTFVEAVASADRASWEAAWDGLVAAYWKPVYKYLRLAAGASESEAEDWTQGFFARALEKDLFRRYDPGRARFRTYLRTCLDGYVANERKAARRLRRGGGFVIVPLDRAVAERELGREPADPRPDPEACFYREWVRSLYGLAVEDLRRSLAEAGKEVVFALFECYDLDGAEASERPTYASLAAEHGLPTTQVTNHLALARRELRRHLLERLREVCGSEAEVRAEARFLFGASRP